MTLSTIATILGSLAAIISGFVWVIKQFQGTQSQDDTAIDKKISDEKAAVLKGERPKW